MGFKKVHEYIQKIHDNYLEKKNKQLLDMQSDLVVCNQVETFLKSEEFKLLKGVFEELSDEYEAQAEKTKDIMYIMKKKVFKEIEDKLNSMIAFKETIQRNIDRLG